MKQASSEGTNDTSTRILRAASTLVAVGGVQALRVRDIADAAGCSTMGVYSNFGGKDGVVDALYRDGFVRFAHALRSAGVDDPVAMGLAYRTWALANPGFYAIMFTQHEADFEPSDDALADAAAAYQVLVDAIVAGQLAGRFAITDADPSDIAWSIWATCHGAVMLELADMDPPVVTTGYEDRFTLTLHAALHGFAQ